MGSSQLTLRDREELFAHVLDSARVGLSVADDKGVLVFVNRACSEIFGYSEEELTGQSLAVVLPESERDGSMEAYTRRIKGELAGLPAEWQVQRKDGFPRTISVASTRFRNPDNSLMVVFTMIDITDRKRAEQRTAAQHAVTLVLADALTPADAAVRIVATLGETLDWQVGEVWIVEDPLHPLRCIGRWHAPGVDVREFIEASAPYAFAKGQGLPGRAWETGRPEWIRDVTSDPGFLRGKVAAHAGLHAAVAAPIRLGDEVLGVAALFTRDLRDEDPELMSMLEAVGGQAGQFIQRRRAEAQVRANEERFRLLAERSPVGIYIAQDGRFQYVNPQFQHDLGYADADLIGTETASLILAGDRAAARERAIAMLKGVRHRPYEFRVRHKSGETRWVMESDISIEWNGRRAVLGNYIDITEKRQVEQERDRIFMLSIDMLAIIAVDGTIRRVNPAWERTLGYSEDELVGSNVIRLIHRDDRENALHEALQLERGEPLVSLRARFVRKDRGDCWLSWSATPLRDEGVTYCLARDVTGLVRAEEEQEKMLQAIEANAAALAEQAATLDQLRVQAEYLADHDALTGVMNRRAWFAAATEERASAVALFDIDHFKRVNDTYGHPAGDEVLKHVAERLGRIAGPDAPLGRVGGEEFALFFTTGFDLARATCARAVAAFGAESIVLSSGERLTITVSAGLASWRESRHSREASLARTYEYADRALYRAKKTGRHRLVVQQRKAA